MPADRDLLFALIALRLGFVDETRLLEAAHEWFRNGETVLEQVLRWRGMSPSEAIAVGEALKAHLDRAEGDADRAIHALGIHGTLQEALLRLRPPDDLASRIRRIRTDLSGAATIVAPPWEDRYELGGELGRGGLARVVEARDRTLDREVAIKIADRVTGAALERFAREARLTGRLDHPVVVPVYDFGESPEVAGGSKLFISMKRIRGRDLKQILRMVKEGEEGARERFPRRRRLEI